MESNNQVRNCLYLFLNTINLLQLGIWLINKYIYHLLKRFLSFKDFFNLVPKHLNFV